MGQHRRNYTDDYKAAAVERLYEPGATQGSVAKELGITGTQLKTWRLENGRVGSISKLSGKRDEVQIARGINGREFIERVEQEDSEPYLLIAPN